MTDKDIQIVRVVPDGPILVRGPVRIELPDDDHQRLKAAADRYHLSVSGYIRMAVMERIERDEAKGGKG